MNIYVACFLFILTTTHAIAGLSHKVEAVVPSSLPPIIHPIAIPQSSEVFIGEHIRNTYSIRVASERDQRVSLRLSDERISHDQ